MVFDVPVLLGLVLGIDVFVHLIGLHIAAFRGDPETGATVYLFTT
jgi:hypothetical protein